jgi:hypothetical protein
MTCLKEIQRFMKYIVMALSAVFASFVLLGGYSFFSLIAPSQTIA